MKAHELRQLDQDSLIQKANDLKEEVFWLSFKHKSGQMEKSSNIKKTKRDLARMLTVIAERKNNAGEKADGK